ncbi:hypothetical protein [Parageobacillus thermoglucosidasius]|uniref:hypothetical protein n=1 Tax=Parageobacillus thermoglucosidasius TaxID=1426 RepID=UPI00241E9812|nr:hypothetical protein [Parageobacillus thermoglucosidasius]
MKTITKQVSITLSEDQWKWIHEFTKGDISQLLRYFILREQNPENTWSNNACLGYAILGARKLGYQDEEIRKLVRAINSEFDWKSISEAKEVYEKSPF